MQAARLFRSVAAAAVVVASAAIAAAAADFTIPPTPDHYVVDAAGALRSATASALESELRAFEHATGHQVVVSIADTTGGVPLETYTAQTAHAWRIGRKGKDDGAVLFLFVQDRKVRIEVGYGLESALTDAASDQIIQTVIVPRMRAGDVDGAVLGGVTKMLHSIDPSFAPTATAEPATNDVHSNPAAIWFVVIFLIVFSIPWIIFAIVLVRARRRRWTRGSAGASGFGTGLVAGSAFSGSESSRSSSSSSGDGSSGNDFDAGGGDFGGGGASGSW